MSVVRSILASSILAALVLLAPAVAQAERAGADQIVELPPIEITASPPAPSAVYVIPRSGTHLEQVDRRDSFLREVTESVRRAPF